MAVIRTYYEEGVNEILDIAKVQLLAAMVDEGVITEYEAEAFAILHIMQIREGTFFRSLTSFFKDNNNDSGDGPYVMCLKKVPNTLEEEHLDKLKGAEAEKIEQALADAFQSDTEEIEYDTDPRN